MKAKPRSRFAILMSGVLMASSFWMAVPSIVRAVPPPGQDFTLTVSDLAFFLKQIDIAEAHAETVVTEDPDSSPLCGPLATFDDDIGVQTWYEPDGGPCVGSPLLAHGLRTVDGRWNNLQPNQEYYGASGQRFPRLLDPVWREAEPVPPFAPSVPGQPTSPTNYAQTFGFVYDSEPRTISNLTVQQTTDNPAAVEILIRYLEDGLDAGILDADANEIPIPLDIEGNPDPVAIAAIDGGRIFLQNVASDEGLSAPFSSWFTIFGQFFDHGLDLVEKGGSGTVVVPLQPDDPLWIAPTAENPNPPNFLMLTRATNEAGDDGVVGTPDDVHEHLNRTTPFIDQNQTYTSHASHQVFLREYELVGGVPVPTGRLLDGDNGGMGTWADVKEQALTILGIELNDYDVLNVPLVYADPYGRFVPSASGFPQVATETGFVSGTPAAPVVTGEVVAGEYVSNVLRANNSFLDDLAHGATPFASSGDPLTRGLRDPETQLLADGDYDGDLLDDHFITGDGRGNENIALTAVHHVFHSEHNRLTGQIESVLDESPELRAAYEKPGYWDYSERLFQAARFVNEMEYQHLAIEEFVRKVQPMVDNPPLNEAAYHSELNAAITAEFAHVVYRFGHSMLTETLPRIHADGTVENLTLLDGFLNPRKFHQDAAGNPVSSEEAAGSLIRGLTAQTGNAIDEMITDTLRNNLLGLPLDLATINLTRARDVGVPPLQAARQSFYAATLDPTLEPYDSWEDFRLSMKHPESIVNFVAAYGIDPSLEAAADLEARRAAAEILMEDSAFMNAPAADSGLNDVDFWIGGLAERTMPFGGMLGTTFNFVFESQGEHLQNADRFYYLTRNQGRNLFTQLEANSFSELVQRNTTADAVPADVFAFPDPVFSLDELMLIDPATWPAGLTLEPDGTVRFNGGEHIVIYGTDGPESVRAGDGDDSVWGRADDDRIEGGAGNDSIFGGDGDDIITDIFGDDTIHGGTGNDAIRGGQGEDLLLPGSGDDFTYHTGEITQSFNGPGNDFARGGGANDQMWGNEGDDWLEGGNGHDLVQGDHALSFQNDPNGGDDVLVGGAGNNDLDSDGGDDILISGPGTDRNEGMLGFDWATYKGHEQPVIADMRFSGLLPPDVQAIRDRFDFVEGLSGWDGNDVLRGVSKSGDLPEIAYHGHHLTEASLDRIAGLEEILRPDGHADYAARFMAGGLTTDSEGVNNIILGGGGSDIIEGRPGDDFIDGDAWLNAQIEWNNPAGGSELADGMSTFGSRVFDGEINPGDLSIVRSVETPSGQEDVIDTAVYFSAFDAYTITNLGDGYWRVFNDAVDELEEGEGSDIIHNIEQLQFDDQCVWLLTGFPSCPTYGTISFDHENPVEDEPIVATVTFNGSVINPTDLNFQWQFGEEAEGWEPSPNSTGIPDEGAPLSNTLIPGDVEASNLLRVVVTFTDDDGQLRSITSAPVANAVLNENDLPMGLVVTPMDPQVGDVLTASGLTDGDSIEDVVEDGLITYTWQQNSADGATDWVDIVSGSDPSFLVTEAQIGRQVRVVVTYTDDLDTAETAIGGPTAVVTGATNNAPAGSIVLSTAAPQVGGAISIDTSGLTDADGLGTLSYEWQRLPSSGTWTAIVGANGPSLTPAASLVGQRLRVVVSYTDGAGNDESLTSAQTDVVVAADPDAVPFADIAGSKFVADIEWVWEQAITFGCAPDAYCPDGLVTRSQMATFLVRALELPATSVDYFTDDEGNKHEDRINRLAASGITVGCGAETFCPDGTVTRSQMATFLARALELPATSVDYFTDDEGNKHESRINRLSEAGITSGCGPTSFCPNGLVTRGQMAAFLHRGLTME